MSDFEKLIQAVQDDLADVASRTGTVEAILGMAQVQALLAIAIRIDAIASYYETMTDHLGSLPPEG